ncbi:MAG TPA: hypothetical protein VIE43_05260 [Thermoanaerobaculia bacterium]|jgi:hypothetical protein|nr:hypothetical protein [Thermoanaerobaculia bacterium]
MKKQARRLTLNRETLRLLAGKPLEGVAGGVGFVTQHCPCTQTCDSCYPCTVAQSCVSGIECLQ